MDISLSVLGGLALLTAGGELLVRGAAALALRLGITPLVVGLTVVAFGTSSPELAVSVDAALAGLGDVAVGNVVGSNICNIALILGLVAVIRPLAVQAQLIKLDMPLMIGASVLIGVLLADGALGRASGAACVALLVAWVLASVRLARRESAAVAAEFSSELAMARSGLLRSGVLLVLGLAALIAGGGLFVRGAVDLARALGLSDAVIGLTLVAIGTSLPELATSLVAAVRGHGDIAIANVVGSNLFNILGILGVTAIVAPIEARDVRWADLAVMLAVALVLLPMAVSHSRLSRAEGALLLTGYAGYAAWLVARA